MTQDHHYAQALSDAFITARQQYTEALSKFQAAKQARDAAQDWHPEKYVGESERAHRLAEASYLLAEEAFQSVERSIWPTFNRRRKELREQLEEEVRGGSTVSPEDVDAATLELLKSGIMEPDDYRALAEKYSGNSTMLKFISKCARELADRLDNSRAAERGSLYALAQACQAGGEDILQKWDALSSVADYCSGQTRTKPESPEFIVSMSKHWEALSGDAVEQF